MRKRPWWKVVLFPVVYPPVMALYYAIALVDRLVRLRRQKRECYIHTIRRREEERGEER